MTAKKMTALLIDDSKLSRNLLKHYIFSEYDDVDVIEEHRGASGLQTYFGQEPHLTFLDLTMPEMSGFEFLEEVKKRGKKGKIAVLSADVQEISRQTALSLGADFFIAKPIKTQLAKINSIVDNIRGALGLGTVQLSPEQKDSIAEVFNIGVGKAADSLSKLTGLKIDLSIPQVELVERAALTASLRDSFNLKGKVITLQQGFKGDFHGMAFLILPPDKLRELVGLILSGEADLDEEEVYRDSATEIGNIIISSCLSAFGNTVETPLTLLPPAMVEAEEDILTGAGGDPAFMRHALVARVGLGIRQRNIDGFLVLVISVGSMKLLLACLKKMSRG
ncbi:MAG: response regulator [Nitrospinae bacterium]|nr:response regulator [Nitrospinota bacterium]